MSKNNHRWLMRIVEGITDLSYYKLFILWGTLAISFGVLYFILSFMNGGNHGPTGMTDASVLSRFVNSMYYSIITATSTGYGDITPQGFSKILASAQSISALFIFAVFVTKLVSHKQEDALKEVHKLTFEDIFHNSREELYIIRKDFDEIINEARMHKNISERSWENLVAAYRQAQTTIEEIPEFYGTEDSFYTIDKKREQLLLSAVRRTLHRVNQMLNVLSEEGIDWVSHHESLTELRELMNIVDNITPEWKEKTQHQKPESFEDIMHLKEQTHGKITGAMPQ